MKTRFQAVSSLTVEGRTGSAPLLTPHATEVVPTLDCSIPKGKNVVWCASFLAGWKSLAEKMAEEPLSLAGAERTVASLNNAPDPRAFIPEAALYATAGWKQRGIIEQIHSELAQKFPHKQPPAFPGAAPDSFVAYAYLEANVKFSLPYFQSGEPLAFIDSAGKSTPVCSFGIRPEDEFSYKRLRGQARLLFRKGLDFEHVHNMEFAIDLCRYSSPSQIVVARIPSEPTLAAAIARVKNECAASETRKENQPRHAPYLRSIGPSDVLLVPDLLWQLSHHFSELEGGRFLNSKLPGQRLDIAQQDILFRLDRSGADLKSESQFVSFGGSSHFLFDRPFLIYMCQRGSKEPYFALWIDNAELLTKWPVQDSPHCRKAWWNPFKVRHSC